MTRADRELLEQWTATHVLAGGVEPTRAPSGGHVAQPGTSLLLKNIARIWANPEMRANVVKDAENVTRFLDSVYGSHEKGKFGIDEIDRAVDLITAYYDPDFGGFGSQPKFPSPSSVELVLRAAIRTGDKKLMEKVTVTLDKMATGGIHDHIGGGFHRYSVTRDWLVPHFEKMLYDNGQLLSLYSWAYLATGRELYRETAQDIALWVAREMTGEHGGFYAAQDAVNRAREGGGPSVIECKTMRMLGHAIHDGAEYVPEALLASWEARDPLTLFEGKLLAGDIVDGQHLADTEQRCKAVVAAAIEAAEADEWPDPATVTDGVFAP